MKTTKKALFSSVLALILCFSMLVGTTFAWFTDKVESANNIITAGNLDVELEYKNVVNGQLAANWTKVQGASKIFNPDALWEPGHVEVVYLKVSNLGTLALKYQLGVNFKDHPGTNVNNEELKLSDHLVFKVVEIEENEVGSFDRTNVADANDGMGLKDYNGKTTKLEAKNAAGDNNFEDYVALIIYMPTTVGNEANYKTGTTAPTIDLGIKLFATQVEGEFDSFDETYDEEAWHPEMQVYTAADLQAALSNAEPGTTITLMDNIDATEPIVIPAAPTTYSLRTNAITINLNGKTITGTKGRDADNNRIHVLVNNGILTINGGTIKSSGFDGGSAIYNNEGASLTVNDVVLYGAPLSDPVYEAGVQKPFPSYAINNYGNAVINGATIKSYHGAIATGGNGTTIINDADIDVGLGTSTGITSYAIYSYENAQVTVNGGKFAFTKKEIYVNGGNTFCELGTNPILINGGTYIGTSFSAGEGREYIIKAGTFDKDPSNQKGINYVADGYKAVENNGQFVVVPGNVDKVIMTASDLLALSAKTFTGNNGQTESYTIMLGADIDMNGADFSAIIAQRGDTLNFIGNGYTISNVNIISGAEDNTTGQASMFYCFPDSTLNVSDLILKDITVTSDADASGYAAAVIGYCEGAAVLNNVDVVNATVNGAKSSGVLAGHVGNGGTMTANNCDISGTVTLSDYEANGHYAGKYLGTMAGDIKLNTCTADVTVSGNLNANNIGDIYGRKVSGSLVIDGVYVLPAATQEALDNAINAGETEIALPAGNYAMPEINLQGKTLTIKGTKDTIIDVSTVDARNQFVTGANLVFDGVTLNFGKVNYMGFANTASLTYRNCDINGLQFLFGANISFENCKLNSNGAEHCVWTYGAKNVSFTGCDFTYGDRAINCYSDNDVTGGKQTVNFTNCTFTTENTASEGAVEINSCFFSVGIEVTMEGCTAPAYGQMAYVSRWDSTNGAKTTINIK